MYFLRDDKKKIVFGWSAKCGCSHVKMIYKYLAQNVVNFKGRHIGTYNKLGFIDDSYSVILIIRNPFERLVSGYLEKYRIDGQYRKKWKKNIVLNFKNFVDELVNKSEVIDRHHFTPQLSEHWNDKIYSHKNLKIYDIKNIDYSFLEKLYNKKIPADILDYRGCFRAQMKNKTEILQGNVKAYEIELDKHKVGSRYSYDKYYNTDIKKKVLLFYKKDFDFFTKHGFNYLINAE
jgi:hypothetical protein